MAFSIRPLKFSHTDRALAVERTLRTTHNERSVVMAAMIREVEKGRGFLLGGVRGCGKTSLLHEVSFHFNSQVANVVALGPLSLSLVTANGLDSLGSQLDDWFRQNETQLSYSSCQPTNADSFDAWLPLLKRLMSQHNADTLLLLLNDLDRLPLEDRETILQDIQDSSWAIASRVVLGCAEHLTADEISLVSEAETANRKTPESYYRDGDGGSDELVSVRLKKHCFVELLSALTINLGMVPALGKKGGKGKGGGSYGWDGKSSALTKPPGKPGRPFGKPDRLIDGGKPSSRAKPSTRAAEPPRYVNLWFAKDRVGESQIARTFALALDKEVYLRMSIGRFEVLNIMNQEEAPKFPDKEIVKAFPETAGKPLPLEATIFSNDFDVPEAERTQKFNLVRGQESPRNPFRVANNLFGHF